MTFVRISFVLTIVSWGQMSVPQASNARKGPSVRLLGDFGSPMSSLLPRRGAYGFDAPYAPLLMALGGTCLLALLVWRLWHGEGVAVVPYRISIAGLGVGALWLFLNAGSYVYATRAGKFAVWAELLDRLEL